MERVCFFAQQTFHDAGRSPLEEGSCRQTADDRGGERSWPDEARPHLGGVQIALSDKKAH